MRRRFGVHNVSKSVSVLINCQYMCSQALNDKKLKGQLAVRENLYGKSAKAAAKAEKVNFLFFFYHVFGDFSANTKC